MPKVSYFIRIVLPSVGMPEKGSYNVQESCRILGVSRATVYRMLKDGRLRYQNGEETIPTVYRAEFEKYFSAWDFDE